MKEDNIKAVEEAIEGWEYMAQLPDHIGDFQLRRMCEPVDDRYELYSYTDEKRHRSVTVYFHEETMEYKLRVKVNLIEFCRIEFIAAKLDAFEGLLRQQFEGLIQELTSFDPRTISGIVRRKGILDWEAAQELPAELEGFTLDIRPDQPVRINNGSCIIIDYVDDSISSSVTLYYNIYRDEFFGEAYIWGVPDVTYEFDAQTLEDFEARLNERLQPRMQQVRRMAADVVKQRENKARVEAEEEELREWGERERQQWEQTHGKKEDDDAGNR